MNAINQVRQIVLRAFDVAQDAIDSLPIPVIAFHLAPPTNAMPGLMATHVGCIALPGY